MPKSVALYDLALRLYEGLSRELNFNVMLSQRGILNLAHTPAQLEMAARLTNAMQLNGVDAELWGPNEIRERLPLMTQSLNSRYLPNGGVWQRRGGIARHDAVAWGYARAADRLGVDIVENCEATGFMMQNGACVGVETSLGEIRAEAVGVAVAGHSSQLMAKAGVKLPIHSYTLQAMVSEPVKPCLDIVVLHLGTGVYAEPVGQGGNRVRRRSRPHSFVRPARLAADAGDRRLRPSRHVPGLRPTEADAPMGRNRRRRSRTRRPSSGLRRRKASSSIAAGEPEASRRFPPAARCSRICSRPAPITRSAAPSTFHASRPGASSTRRRAPESSIRCMRRRLFERRSPCISP